MGKRGPHPLPKAINDLRGDTDKRRYRKMPEPQPPDGVPQTPEHLTGVARAEWDRCVPVLTHMGVLTMADATALSIYCECYARYRHADDQCKKYGEVHVLKSNDGKPYMQVSAWASMRNKALDHMIKFMVQFGLTPSARSGMAVDKPAKQVQSINDFLRRVA